MAGLEEQLELFSRETYVPSPIEIENQLKNENVLKVVFSLFSSTFRDLLSRGGPGALFTGYFIFVISVAFYYLCVYFSFLMSCWL
jgi:hypothetical protein